MSHTIESKNVPIRIWTDPAGVEEAAQKQLQNIAALPWAFHHVAVMPDVHYGIGATVGSVIAMKDAIAPAAVGVDIGCGMAACLTSVDPLSASVPATLQAVRAQIEATIPVGFNSHDGEYAHKLPSGVERDALVHESRRLFDEFSGLSPAVQDQGEKALAQIGTLGGGNHFIELCEDTTERIWLMLHSGSRGIGNKLATVHIAKARTLAHNAELPDKDLAVFLASTPEMQEYRRDLFWAQRYAAHNRRVMLALYTHVLRGFFPDMEILDTVACHHNYVAEEVHFGEEVLVTRKGAIRAGRGDMGIIPGSMGTRSYIVRGLGNADSFESASHGAGRRMSRGAAKRKYTAADLASQTAGVECRKDDGVIDEIPAAYKDIDQVMANQSDLVEVVAQLKGLLCVKG